MASRADAELLHTHHADLYLTATFKHTPVHYLYRSVKPEMLAALYAAADVCVISSIRDGLNLVSYEFAACQEEKKGVLMMSNYVGAIKTLPTSSMVCFNPWDTTRFSEQIDIALKMSEEEKEKRYEGIMKIVDNWTRLVSPALSLWSCPFEMLQVLNPRR